MKTFTLGGRLLMGIICATILLSLCGCTQQQVDRAEAAVVDARQLLEQAKATERRVEEALAKAREAAEKLQNEQAKNVVLEAEKALAQVHEGVAVAEKTVKGAESAAAAAKAAQEAGGSTIDVLIAVGSTLVPALGGLAVLRRRSQPVRQALQQTVSGLDAARASMGKEAWDEHVAPALECSQDELVKAIVTKIQQQQKEKQG